MATPSTEAMKCEVMSDPSNNITAAPPALESSSGLSAKGSPPKNNTTTPLSAANTADPFDGTFNIPAGNQLVFGAGLPFLTGVDNITCVSPILQSLFSRIEAEFQNLMQENSRLQAENSRLAQKVEVLQQCSSPTQPHPQIVSNGMGMAFSGEQDALLDPLTHRLAGEAAVSLGMTNSPAVVNINNNNIVAPPGAAVSAAAVPISDQKSKLRVAQRTKTGINKIVSTFKAGTLDAVNSGAIVAISRGGAGGGANTHSARCTTVYYGHQDSVWDLDWHPEFDVIASASSDRTVKLWNPGVGMQPVYSYQGHHGAVNSARLHPREPLVVSAAGDGSVHIWRYSRERMQQRRAVFLNSRPPMHSSADDDLMAEDAAHHEPALMNWNSMPSGAMMESKEDQASANDWTLQPAIVLRQPEVTVCSAPVGSTLSNSGAGAGPVMAAEFLGVPGTAGNFVVSGGWDQLLLVSDALTGRLVRVNEGHEGSITNVSCARNGTMYASSSEDRTFRVWDVNNPQVVFVCEGHSRKVRSAAFCAGPGQGHEAAGGPLPNIVSASDDGSLKVWDLRNMSSPLISIRAHSGINRFSILSSHCMSSSAGGGPEVVACPLDNRSIRVYSLSVASNRARRMVSIPPANARLLNSTPSSLSTVSHRSAHIPNHTPRPSSSRAGGVVGAATHSRMVTSVAWGACSKRLLSAAIDGSILEWSLSENVSMGKQNTSESFSSSLNSAPVPNNANMNPVLTSNKKSFTSF